MHDAVVTKMENVLAETLLRLRRTSGLCVAFGGIVRTPESLVIARLTGTRGRSLQDLTVPRGRGLGGHVLEHARPARLDDYTRSQVITHDYDGIVAGEEHLSSVVAVPIIVSGRIRGVLYGGARDGDIIGGRAMSGIDAVARQLTHDLETVPTSTAPIRTAPIGTAAPTIMAGSSVPTSPADALSELAGLIELAPPAMQERLRGVLAALTPTPKPATARTLSPRELEVLSLVDLGATNIEISARLGVSPETVKAYLRAAMRKLGVHTRSSAAFAAREMLRG